MKYIEVCWKKNVYFWIAFVLRDC